VPIEIAERDGVTSWDLVLDGRRRRRLRMTLILDPHLGLVAWVHFAPPLLDNFRRTYRQLLRWNDEFPFAKFAISEDDRPILVSELAVGRLDRDALGVLLARLLQTADVVHDDAQRLVPELRRASEAAAALPPEPTGAALLDRYEAELGELEAAGQS
jgi:hypothetical protein